MSTKNQQDTKEQAKPEQASKQDPATAIPEGIDVTGFEKIDTDLDNFPDWEWDVRDTLRGEVIKVKEARVNRKGKMVDTHLAIVEVDGECFTVWKSANLELLFKTLRPGTQLLLIHKGKERLSNGNDMRMFDAYVQQPD